MIKDLTLLAPVKMYYLVKLTLYIQIGDTIVYTMSLSILVVLPKLKEFAVL